MSKPLEQKIEFKGKRIIVRKDKVLEQSGKETIREVVLHPGAVSIVARPSAGKVILIRQHRYAAGETLIELPAGTIDPGEDPTETARRELLEETGYQAASIHHRATYFTTPGFTNELMYLFEATDLKVGEQSLEDDEAIEVIITSSKEALLMIEEGAIHDAKTMLGLLIVLGG